MHFDEAPAVINLFDPSLPTRAAVAARLRASGWRGQFVWVPITLIAAGTAAARTLLAALSGRKREPLAIWSILRPRRYDARLSTAMFEAITRDVPSGTAAVRARVA
jgi:hypothetical protein